MNPKPTGVQVKLTNGTIMLIKVEAIHLVSHPSDDATVLVGQPVSYFDLRDACELIITGCCERWDGTPEGVRA